MPLIPLILAAATAAADRPSVPPPIPAVSAPELARLLRAEYDGEKPAVQAEWVAASTGDGPARRLLCADSGPVPGPRWVAVCTRYAEAAWASPGRVDLFVLEPGATRREPARVRARFRGLATGRFGSAGPVRLMTVGPGSEAFAVHSSASSGGRLDARLALYVEQGGQLRKALDVATLASNAGVCAPGAGPVGRRCRRQAVHLACTLRADAARVDHGFHPLELRVAGERDGEPVAAVIPIPHDAFGYRVSARVLQSQGCDVDG